jgi:hypothetical protein
MNKKTAVDRAPIIVILYIRQLNWGGEGVMYWRDLNKHERRNIFREDAQFRQELKTRTDVIAVLSKLGPTLNTVKQSVPKSFISGYIPPQKSKNPNHAVEKYKWHAQRQYNIYFRYGCELVYFCLNPAPWVEEHKGGKSFIVPDNDKNGTTTLPEYIKNYITRKKLVPKTKKPLPARIFSKFNDIMAYDFLMGKGHFLNLFDLEEKEDFTITHEQLYFSYYIAWKNLSSNWRKPLDLIKTGEIFLRDILTKQPVKTPEGIKYDPEDYMTLFRYRKAYNKKATMKFYYDYYSPKVFQVEPHSFPVFESKIIQNGKKEYGLLDKLKIYFYKLYDVTWASYKLEPEECLIIDKWRKEVIYILDKIINDPKAIKYQKEEAKKCKQSLDVSYNTLPSKLALCYSNRDLQNRLGVKLNKRKNYLNMLFTKYHDLPRENENGEEYDIPAGPTEETEIESIKEGEIYSLFLYFQVAFPFNHNYLRKVKDYLYSRPYIFINDLKSYIFSNQNTFKHERSSKDRESRLQEEYRETAPHKKKYLDKFNKKIREKILLPIYLEQIFLYGGDKLINLFSKSFSVPDENNFLVYVKEIINNSFSDFKATIEGLPATKTKKDDDLRLHDEYNKAFFSGTKFPPLMKDVKLRREINKFYKKIKGDYRHLRNSFLICFHYFKRNNWEDDFWDHYSGKKTKEDFRKTIDEIRKIIMAEG